MGERAQRTDQENNYIQKGQTYLFEFKIMDKNAFLNIRDKKGEDHGFGLNRARLNSNLALIWNIFLSKLQSANQFTMSVKVKLAKDRL